VERYGPALDALAADAVGVNCSSGPYAAVNALEQLRKSTSKPLSLIPGAGWGRIYSPEYFARSVPGQELAIVGGCCGTTPEHIAALKGEHAPANRIVGQVTGIESSGPGAEPMLTIDAHGRSARELQQRLLELHECGHRRIVCRSRCRASDIDAVGLVHLAASLNRGEDLGGNPITPTQFSVGFAVNLDGDDLERAATAGAQFAITEPVFDVARFDALLQRSPIPVIATLRPVMDPRTADYLVNERGISIPQDVLDRIAAGEGEAVVRELAEALRPLASGLHVTFG
jgi:homocysteine S-methyltransferase